MEGIVTVAKFKDGKEDRELTTIEPKVLACTTLADLVAIQGEELVLAQAKAQLIVSFRAKIRAKMSTLDDNGDFKYTDDEIINDPELEDWKPSLRVRQSDQDKAVAALANCEVDELEALVAEAKAKIAAKKATEDEGSDE